MAEVAKDILSRHDELRDLRRPEERVWKSLARLLVPDEQDFDPGSKIDDDRAELFDSSPLYALDNFVGGIFGQLTNPVNRWMEYAVEGDDDLSNWGPVRNYLYARANAFYASVDPGASNFYLEIPAVIGNLGAFGLGTLYQEEEVGAGAINDRSIPLGQTFIDTDASGRVDTSHREYRLRGRQFKRRFGGAYGGNVDDQAEICMVHAVRANQEFVPGRFGMAGKPFLSTYCSPDLKDFRRDGGYFELPFHHFMWKPRAGRVYPTGPGHNARADAASLNEMERSHLVAAQFAAEPPVLLHDDSVLTAADIAPNAVLHGTIADNGKPLLGTLNRGQNVALSLAQSDQKRQAIKTAFYYGIMQLVNRPQMTATEFLGFQGENLRLMAPNLVRVQAGISSFVARRDGLLGRAGQLPPPPPELVGKRLKVVYQSALAKAMLVENGRAVLQLAQATEALAVTDPRARDRFDVDVAMKVLGKAFTGEPGVIRDDKATQSIRDARAKDQAAQAQLTAAGQVAEIAATAGHAAQASTLAQGRNAA